MRIPSRGLPLLALLAACGADGTGPGDGTGAARPLTGAEAAAISRVILGPGVNVAQQGASGAAAPAPTGGAAPTIHTGSLPFGFTVPCQPTGTTAVSGTLSAAWNPVAQAAVIHAAASLRPNACAVRSEGQTLTVTGDPSLELTLTAAGDATGLKALLLTESGALTWTRSDGSTGRCAVQVAGLLVAGTPNYHVTGTVCGVSVDYTGPL